MNFKPLFDRVLIEPEMEESISASGIVLPDTSQERPQYGKVVAVGSGLSLEYDKVEMQVKIGNRVLFSKYAGAEIKIENKTYIVLRQIDIVGVVND